jgi:hypothetical protein
MLGLPGLPRVRGGTQRGPPRRVLTDRLAAWSADPTGALQATRQHPRLRSHGNLVGLRRFPRSKPRRAPHSADRAGFPASPALSCHRTALPSVERATGIGGRPYAGAAPTPGGDQGVIRNSALPRPARSRTTCCCRATARSGSWTARKPPGWPAGALIPGSAGGTHRGLPRSSPAAARLPGPQGCGAAMSPSGQRRPSSRDGRSRRGPLTWQKVIFIITLVKNYLRSARSWLGKA